MEQGNITDRLRSGAEISFLVSLFLFISISAVQRGALTTLFHLMVALSLLFPLMKNRNLPWPLIKRLSYGFLFYVLSAALSLINTSNWHTGDWYFGRYYRFLFVIPVIIFVARTRAAVEKWVIGGAVVSSLTMAYYSLHQMIFSGVTRVGLAGYLNQNRYGEIGFVSALIILVAILRVPMRTMLKFTLVLPFVLGVCGGLSSGSRGALLAFVATGLFLAWKCTDTVSFKKRLRAVGASVLILAVLISSLVYFSPYWRKQIPRLANEPLQYLSGHYDFEASSVHVRMHLAQGGLLIWKKHPFIGTGLGDIENDMKELVKAKKLPGNLTWSRLHNSYIDVLARSGIIGLFGFLTGALYIPFRTFLTCYKETEKSSERAWASVLGMALVFFFAVDGVASSCFSNKSVYVYLGLLGPLLGLSLRERQVVKILSPNSG